MFSAELFTQESFAAWSLTRHFIELTVSVVLLKYYYDQKYWAALYTGIISTVASLSSAVLFFLVLFSRSPSNYYIPALLISFFFQHNIRPDARIIQEPTIDMVKGCWRLFIFNQPDYPLVLSLPYGGQAGTDKIRQIEGWAAAELLSTDHNRKKYPAFLSCRIARPVRNGVVFMAHDISSAPGRRCLYDTGL